MLVQAQNEKERSLERAQLAELKAKSEQQYEQTESARKLADDSSNANVEVKEIVQKDEPSDECVGDVVGGGGGGDGESVTTNPVNGVDALKKDETVELDGTKVVKIETDEVGDGSVSVSGTSRSGGGAGVGCSDEEDNNNGISIDPRTYCKLGHFHLLLEEYPKGMLIEMEHLLIEF